MLSPQTAQIATIALLLVAGAAQAQSTILVSSGFLGLPAVGDSFFSSVSDDGTRVVFQSSAANLVPGDTNTTTDVFLFDRTTGQVSRISTSQAGVQGNGLSQSPRISGNGRFVSFESAATNLIVGAPTANAQIFRKDLLTGAVDLVSARSSDGRWGSGFCFNGGISRDGRYVTFTSQAEDLIATDNNSRLDVFRRDMNAVPTLTNAAMLRMSISSASQQGISTSFTASISANGNRVAFVTASNNLVPGDTNGSADVLVRDVSAGTTTLVSQNDSGQIGNDASQRASISSDGNYVVFDSLASNLGANNFANIVYIRNISAGTTTPITDFVVGNSFDPMVAEGGQTVAFWSTVTTLVPGVPANTAAVYVAKANIGGSFGFELISKNASNLVGPDSFYPAISADARYVSFESDATNLVPGDTNGRTDVYLRDRGAPASGCLVDFNADGFLNQEDLGGFLTAFLDESTPAGPSGTNTAPCPGEPAPYATLGYAADYNRDCSFNQEDLAGYLTDYFGESENPVNCIPG